MGPRVLASKVPPHAGIHALHVRRRRPDIQHGHCVHAPLESVQEPRRNQQRVRGVRARVLITQGVEHPAAAEGRISVLQPAYSRSRAMEVSLYGIVADRDGRLVGVRDPRTAPGDAIDLDVLPCTPGVHCSFLYTYSISPLQGHPRLPVKRNRSSLGHFANGRPLRPLSDRSDTSQAVRPVNMLCQCGCTQPIRSTVQAAVSSPARSLSPAIVKIRLPEIIESGLLPVETPCVDASQVRPP